MAYAFTQDLPITPEIWEALKAQIGEMPPELVAHLVVRREGGLRYIDIWESKEAYERFIDERVHPVVERVFEQAGRERPPEPGLVELDVVDLLVPEHRAGAGSG